MTGAPPMTEPFLLSPALKSRIWGGDRAVRLYGRELSPDGTAAAEYWECSSRADGPSTVYGGRFDGMSLGRLLDICPEITGGRFDGSTFPVLFKVIDAGQKLSVQVHPGDSYAAEHENGQLGKTECWYVIDAEPGAYVICGFREGVGRETAEAAMRSGGIEPLLKKIPVRRGSLIPVGAGTVHAIGGGILIAEIQENSDLTYRIYDWGRLGTDGKPRRLDTGKASEVTVFPGDGIPGGEPDAGFRADPDAGEGRFSCRYFTLDVLRCRGGMTLAPGGGCCILFCVSGRCGITARTPSGEMSETLEVGAGKTAFIPAGAENLYVGGNCGILYIHGF